ncbi:MAG: flagellin [Enterobacteriaceae bacterium]
MFNNASSMTANRALNTANNALGVAMGRLGTGKRVNTAKDDAAGLQIATRLDSQVRGMNVAQNNIANANSLLQTTEGAMDEFTNILHRMKDLATQAANDTNTADDRNAMQSEFDQLNTELKNIMDNTSFGGEKLFGTSGKMQVSGGLNLQIGNSSGEVMKVDLRTNLESLNGVSGAMVTISSASLSGHTQAQSAMAAIDAGLKAASTIRSDLGAFSNRLDHVAANVSNMKDNTELAMGNIVNADYATEVSSMTRNQMLSQMGMGMLKQSNGMSGMVMQLL